MTLTATRTLAFLFTDIEGSTRLWERHPEAMRVSLAQHDGILSAAVAGAHGQIVKTTGDGIMAAFETAAAGVLACLTAQQELGGADWLETGPLRVRMGLHVGDGAGDGSDYHGPAVNRAARIMAAGHGGQILVSASTAALVMDQLPAGTTLRDLGEHLLKDLARPERLYQLDYPSMPTFLPLATSDVRIGSLPEEPSPFVGREEARAQVVARLADSGIRLLTLTGPGGIGKTRLALRAARDAEPGFRAGAAFVDLAAARDTTAVLTAIARQLGFKDASEQAQLSELIGRLAPLQLLLILDNVEQVTTAAPTLLQLLQACPELTMLVTSREPLRVRGEHIVVVAPLGLPPADPGPASAQQLEQFEAVLLFVERARAVKPDFRVTDENAALVADICRRLEGLPLAIELAVARLRVFSLEVLRERLGSRLRALGSGPRDLPERQQTLRATIDWSYQLLPPAEQRLFGIMACFSGADIEAVETVVAELSEWLPDVEPVDGLVSLADKSLLRQVFREDGTPRFEMLESVKEYALEQIEADPESARQTRMAHARYYGRWASEHVARLRGPERTVAIRELADEVENLRSAWRCAIMERDLPQIEALLGAMQRLYDARGWYRALSGLAADALGVVGSLDASPERDVLTASLLSDQARALTALEGYTAEVEAAYERLLASLEGADYSRLYPVLRALASLYGFRSDPGRAAEMGRQLLAVADRTGDPEIRVEGYLNEGTGTSFAGHIGDGLPLLEAGVAWWKEHPYESSHFRLGPDPRVSMLTALSLLGWWQGGLDVSLERSVESLALARELHHPSTSGYALYHAALLHLWRDEPTEARELAVRVIEVADEHELHIWSAVGTIVLGAAAAALGIGDEGLRWVSEGLQRYRGLRTPPVFWPFLLQVRARACQRAGEIEAGLESAREGLAMAPHVADLHIVHGDLLLDAADPAGAEAAFAAGLAAARGWEARTPELRAALRLCRLDAADAVRSARLASLREVTETFGAAVDSVDLVAARALLSSQSP